MAGYPPVPGIGCDGDDSQSDISSIVTTDNIQIINQLNLTNLFGQPITSMSTVVTDNTGEVVTK